MKTKIGEIYMLRDSITKPVPSGFNTIYPEPEVPDEFGITLPAGARLEVLGLAGPPYNKDFQVWEDPEMYRTIMVKYNGRTFAMREHKILSPAYKKVGG